MVLRTRSSLLANGFSDAEIRARVRRGELIRLTPGVYRAPRAEQAWLPSDDFVGRSLAAAHCAGASVLSHLSAAAVWGLPLASGTNTRLVHLTRAGRSGGMRRNGLWVHTAELAPDEVTVIDTALGPTRVTTPARTLVDLARIEPLLTAVTAADAALQRELCLPTVLADHFRRQAGRKGIGAAARALRLVDGRAESPRESWVRVLFAAAGLPAGQSQVEIRDEDGRFVGRADGMLEEAFLLWEYDGQGKYRELRGAQDLSTVILNEKYRQDRFTELGWLVLRIQREDQTTPQRLVERARRMVASRHGVARPRGSWLPLPWTPLDI